MRHIITLAAVLCLAGCMEGTGPAPTTTSTAEPAVDVAPTEASLEVEPVEEPEAPAEVAEAPAEPSASDAEAKLLAVAKRRNALAATLRAFANTVDDSHDVGTIYANYGVPEARCYAMGVLLGMPDAVEHLNDEGSPDLETMTWENAYEVRVLALEHSNFAHVLEAHVGHDPDQLVLKWNLECPGTMDIPASARHSQEGIASFYELNNDGKVLMVLGDIEAGFADKVIAALEANPSVKTVSLGSGGGYVMEAMKAGDYIRSRGYDTVLWSGCYSACPLVFMAGKQREIWSPYPDLGFHQVARGDGQAVAFNDPIYQLIVSYLVRMDIEPRMVLSNMLAAPPHGMVRISGADPDLCDANVATWSQRMCFGKSYAR